MRARLLGVLVLATLVIAVSVAGATRSRLRPLRVQSASLTQSARQVIWKLRLTEPFAPAALARDARSLCLALERLDGGSVTGQLCVDAPRPGHRGPQIVYQRITAGGPGRAVPIAAAISRSDSRELTVSFEPPGFGLSYRCTGPGRAAPPATGGLRRQRRAVCHPRPERSSRDRADLRRRAVV